MHILDGGDYANCIATNQTSNLRLSEKDGVALEFHDQNDRYLSDTCLYLSYLDHAIGAQYDQILVPANEMELREGNLLLGARW